VILIGFAATPTGSGVRLTWQTASENCNLGFRLWRQEASGNFEALSFVPGAGNCIDMQHYTFIDESADRGYYTYRLQQINDDGDAIMLDVHTVMLGDGISFSMRRHNYTAVVD
jgi:hypothetical protein